MTFGRHLTKALMFLALLGLPLKAGELHTASMLGDLELIQSLLQDGADLEEIEEGNTPLSWALFGRQAAAALLLVESGADPNAPSTNLAPLAAAAALGSKDLVVAMLQSGADPNVSSNGATPLSAAAMFDHAEISEILIEAGADPRQRFGDGFTALHVAAENGAFDVAKVLLDAGADVGALASNGRPAIHFAVISGNTDLVELLLAYGWQPDPIEAIEPLIADADLVRGRKEAEKCFVCHPNVATIRAYRGPTLWDIFGRQPGEIDGFRYSSALLEMNWVWSYETLNQYIANPRAAVPGTSMESPPIGDATKRAAIIAYLRQLSDNPAALP